MSEPCQTVTALAAEVKALRAEFLAFKDLMDERQSANKDAIAAAFISAEKVNDKTELALKEYKTGANEWRDTVRDLISNLRESRSGSEGRDRGIGVSWGVILGAIGAVGGILALIKVL